MSERKKANFKYKRFPEKEELDSISVGSNEEDGTVKETTSGYEADDEGNKLPKGEKGQFDYGQLSSNDDDSDESDDNNDEDSDNGEIGEKQLSNSSTQSESYMDQVEAQWTDADEEEVKGFLEEDTEESDA